MENEDKVESVTDSLEDAGKIDLIVDALASAPNGTMLIQNYLDLKKVADAATGSISVLQEANSNLRTELGHKELELRETRRALNGQIPTVIEVVKEVEKKVAAVEEKHNELSIDDIRSLFDE